MRGLENEKTAIQRMVLEPVGIIPEQQRYFAEQADSLGMDAALERLPATDEPQQDLQDPVTGATYFVADYSDPTVPHLVQ